MIISLIVSKFEEELNSSGLMIVRSHEMVRVRRVRMRIVVRVINFLW